MVIIEEIKKLLDSDKLLIGAEQTIKELRKNNISKVYVSTNVKKDTFEDMKHMADIQSVEIVEVGVPNDELGVMCKKPFAISVLGVKKE